MPTELIVVGGIVLVMVGLAIGAKFLGGKKSV
jgi:hypothetical protein